jgi:Protein of unknown function (DUF3300)
MNIFEPAGWCSKPRLSRQILASFLLLAVLVAIWPQDLWAAYQDTQPPAQPAASAPPYTQQAPEQLQQLVAPIALYPDSLVAQVLAASTFPEQVVEADRWVQANPDLKGSALGQAVDQQPWDPSVKALTAFPSVLGNMDKNLSWTSSLGDAYYNQQPDVMNAIQVMRQRAQAAGNLQSTPQQTVETQGSTIAIQPANPEVVYVPAYNPWLVYGGPIVAWPGWYPYPGIWFGGPYLSFGLGFGIGFFSGFGWGWGHWGFDWHQHYPIYNNARYYSHSNTFYNRNYYYRGGGARGVATNVERGVSARGGYAGRPGGVYNRPGATPHPFSGNTQAARGYAESHGDSAPRGVSAPRTESASRGVSAPRAESAPRVESGVRSGAFSNYDHGGEARSYSSRGSASFGGGGARGGGAVHSGGRPR